MSAFLEARSHEFAILLHLGMEKRQMNRLVFRDDDYWLWLHYSRDCLWFLVFKILFMIVREILHLDDLPLYVSWEPFY